MKIKAVKKVEVTKTNDAPQRKTNKRMTSKQLIEDKIRFMEEIKSSSNNALTDVGEAELAGLYEQLKLSKRGRGSKQKGASYERHIAEIMQNVYDVELKRTPQSGGFAKKTEKANDFRGDIIPITKGIEMLVHIECKNQKTWKLKDWLTQAQSDCPAGKMPIVILKRENTNKVGVAGNQQDLVVIDLQDFTRLVPKEKIFIIKKR